MKQYKVCKYCGKEFENIEGRAFSSHVKWCEKNPNVDLNITKKKLQNRKRQLDLERYGELKWFEVECYKCGVRFCIKERDKKFPEKEKYFCCRSHANSKTNSGPKSKESRLKVSQKSKKCWQDPNYRRKVMNSNAWNKFSSKGERDLQNFFLEYCSDDEWTFGGGLKIEDKIISRDLYSKKLKFCIEFDGIWHFKDIHGQLEDKQYRDNLLETWCIDNGYKLIRIEDGWYNKDPKYWKHIILDEAYNGNKQIIKFGDNYGY